jgi:hypothetical protein
MGLFCRGAAVGDVVNFRLRPRVVDDHIFEQALANPFDNFAVSSSLRKRIMDLMVDRNDQNAALVANYIDEDDSQRLAFRLVAKQIYDEIRGEE